MLQYKLPVELVENGEKSGNWRFSFLDAPMHKRLKSLAKDNGGEAIWIGTLNDVNVPDHQLAQVLY